jgi:hypothetical protein
MNRRLDGPQSESSHFGKDINLLLLPGFEAQIIKPIA